MLAPRCSTTPPGGHRNAEAAESPAPRTRAELTAHLDRLLADPALAGARVAVLARDLATGQDLYARNAGDALNPASNVKLLTTAAALALLGPAHRYETRLLAAPDAIDGNTVRGDLVLRGGGDPALTTGDLYELAGELRARGIRKVTGRILVDGTRFARDGLPPGFEQKDEFASYRAPVGAATVNSNTFVVRVAPGATVGAAARVTVDPPVPMVTVDGSDARTVDGRKRKLTVAPTPRANGTVHVVVRGEIGQTARIASYRYPVANPSRYAGEVLRLVLRQRGIRVARASVRRGHAPARARTLATHRSPALGEIVRWINKHSNNFMAEQVLLTLDPDDGATFERALARADGWLAGQGVAGAGLRHGNGSGLYDTNRASPRHIVTLLEHVHGDFRLAPDFEASLAIGGVDGTMRKRLKDQDLARGWARVKTGTLDGVSALSGYAGALGRAPIVFSFLINDLPRRRRRDARRVQDAVLAALVGYAARTAPHARPANRPAPTGS